MTGNLLKGLEMLLIIKLFEYKMKSTSNKWIFNASKKKALINTI